MSSITINELKPGDQFRTGPNPVDDKGRRSCQFSGTVVKVARVNFTWAADYMGHPLTVKGSLALLIGGQVARDGEIFDIIWKAER
jgi:hypothetical protein